VDDGSGFPELFGLRRKVIILSIISSFLPPRSMSSVSQMDFSIANENLQAS